MKHLVTAIAILLSAPAIAHIELTSPEARYANNGVDGLNKHCPCGSGGGDQYCANGVTTDANRDASRVTSFPVGKRITVQWQETVGHVGRFRVAFDGDGADEAVFDQNILADIADPDDGTGARSVDVTLPTQKCTNCTLQLIQVMNDDVTDPVVHLSGTDPDRTYFQCADITLVGEGEGEGETRDPPAPTGCAATGSSGPGLVVALFLVLMLWRRSVR